MHIACIAHRHVAKADKTAQAGKREARHQRVVAGFGTASRDARLSYLQSAFFWLSAYGVNCCSACISWPA